MSRLTRDGTAETVSRDQILRRERGQEKVHFHCSADHVQDGQPYTVDLYSCYMCDHTYVGEKPTVILYTTCIAIVASHIQRIGRQPERTILYSGQSRCSWSGEQGNVYSSVYAIPVAFPSFMYQVCMYGNTFRRV